MNVFLPGIVGAGRHRLEIFHEAHALPPERFTIGMLQANDVFRGAPPDERILEIGSEGNCAVRESP